MTVTERLREFFLAHPELPPKAAAEELGCSLKAAGNVRSDLVKAGKVQRLVKRAHDGHPSKRW